MNYVFMVFHAGNGVPDDVLDFDTALAPPLGNYENVKVLLARGFPGIEWDDASKVGSLSTASGHIEFSCNDTLLEKNMFSISVAIGFEASDSLSYVESRLSAAGLAALDAQSLQFVGG